MDSEKYKVEVLHYINPHLIWVLVENEREQNKYHFEQIGIYGILPLDVSIDYEGNISKKRCEQWLPAVFMAMKKILLDASEVWFSVTFLDKTVSIFDDNVHKYGDLTIKMKNGKVISMLDKLLDSGFVADDVKYFHQHLNTKLDYLNTLTIINKIKQTLKLLNKPYQQLESSLNKQLMVFLQTKELDETADIGMLNLSDRIDNVSALLRKQIHDLNACKDVDEESAGRANNIMIKQHTGTQLKSEFLKKKLSMVNSQSGCSDVRSIMSIKADDKPPVASQSDQKSLTDDAKESEVQYSKNYYKRKGKNSQINSDTRDKKFVAYGPPGLNPMLYHLKEVKEEKEMIIEKENNENKIEKMEPETDNKIDVTSEVSSDVNIRFSRLDILRQKNRNSIENNNTNKVLENSKNISSKDTRSPSHDDTTVKLGSSILQLKMKNFKNKMARLNTSSSVSDTDSSAWQGDDSDSESITSLVNKLDISNIIKKEVVTQPEAIPNVKHNVNPFKNVDGSTSVFVEKLISPTLMVHTKKGNKIIPVTNMRDVSFGTDIHVVLRNMSVTKPMRLQTVTWPMILRGHSLFIVSPNGSGKTLGYLPAVCRLVSDSIKNSNDFAVSPLTCIILCATGNSVRNIEELCKMFLHEARVFACYTGMTSIDITTTLLNGCDILICTPVILVRLLRDNLGLDLRHLTTFVIDDSERILDVYQNELKFCLVKVREMLKSRVVKELRVQYIVVSCIWSNFMSNLARKAPDTIVCIGAFQECVLYSEVDTTVEFLEKDDKIDAVIKFMNEIDKSKKTVIACRSDDEVHLVSKALLNLKYVVFSCDSNMTVNELYGIDLALSEYKEPLLGPVLVCCDSNLTHLNITDALNLVHFSLPATFSMFCKRFAVLIDNYSSIFDNDTSNVKIKIFLENSNVEQLPKILHFIKRCSSNIPEVLDQICSTVMTEKDLKKAKSFVPLCNTFLSFGACPDIWQCQQRHTLFKDFDEPSAWIPREGIITFKILHYHTAVHYSARMISCTSNNETKKYPQTYSTLSIKLGMYYSKEANRKLLGIAKPGDICAVSLKYNLFVRCQVMKVLKYTTDNIPTLLLINLIDEEKYEMARDTCLYYLPDALKNIESHAVKVILDNLTPHDKDISYSKLAEEKLKNITEKNDEFYMRGKISLVIGNCIFVETLEACQDLSSLNETVVKSNFKNELLDGYAINNPDHIDTLRKIGANLDFMRETEEKQTQIIEVPKPIKILPKPSWAFLECDTYVPVYYLYAKSPSTLFVQHVNFENCLKILIQDIKKYVSDKPEPVDDVTVGDIVLAEFPDDGAYERARIDEVIDNKKLKCFFVDLGDWRVVPIDKILSITENLITQLPFQAIECKLIGIKPLGDEWTDFSTNWLVDQCYDSSSVLKYLFAKRFTKEKAKFTDGGKYGISLIDTYANDTCINLSMIDANLAEENDEIELLTNNNNINENIVENTLGKGPAGDNNTSKCDTSLETNEEKLLAIQDTIQRRTKYTTPNLVTLEDNTQSNQQNIMNFLKNVPIRSVPLVDEDEDDDRWDSVNPMSFLMDKSHNTSNATIHEPNVKPLAIMNAKSSDTKSYSDSIVEQQQNDTPLEATTNQSKIYSKTNDRESNSDCKSNEIEVDDENEDPPLEIDTSQANDTPVSKIASKSKDTQSNSDCTPDKTLRLDQNGPPLKITTAQSKTDVKSHHVKSNSDCNSETTIVGEENNVPRSEISTNQKYAENKTSVEIKPKETNKIWSVLEKDNTICLQDESNKQIKLTWSQDKRTAFIQIEVTTNKYEINIKDKEITFYNIEDDQTGFEFELYGVIDTDTSCHSNKGTYIEIKLNKLMPRIWLMLYKGDVRKYLQTNIALKNTDSKQTEPIIIPDIPNLLNNKTENNSDKEISSVKMQHNNIDDNLRKPKLIWRQTKSNITIKIQLVMTSYDLEIQEKYIKFRSKANDEDYGFHFELYGVIETQQSHHSNKGQYIQVNLAKVMARNWFNLNKGPPKKWVVYDVDDIDVSSEEENDSNNDIENLRKSLHVVDSDSDDDLRNDNIYAY